MKPQRVWQCSDGNIFEMEDDARKHARTLALEDILKQYLDDDDRLIEITAFVDAVVDKWWNEE